MYLLSGIAEVYCCIASDSESDVGNSQPIKIINIVEWAGNKIQFIVKNLNG